MPKITEEKINAIVLLGMGFYSARSLNSGIVNVLDSNHDCIGWYHIKQPEGVLYNESINFDYQDYFVQRIKNN